MVQVDDHLEYQNSNSARYSKDIIVDPVYGSVNHERSLWLRGRELSSLEPTIWSPQTIRR
jgi:hypothetical protein